MRQSTLFGRTLREAPADAQTPGHKLMLRAAIARPLAAGLYSWLPLGFRVARKVEQIIREEMDRIGSQEVRLPVITPAEYWKETGRWDTLEPVTFRTRDHGGHDYMIAYTHEELVMHHARNEILSYRQLPVMVYHFQEKGRDEQRPRAGLLRVREFVMKDAYSIDKDWEGLDRSYWLQHGAYAKAFARMGLDAVSVESDTGNMGGDVAHEFQVLTDVGEDRIAFCSNCDYRANMEKATRQVNGYLAAIDPAKPSEISTPSTTTIGELQASLGQPAEMFLKTVLLRDDAGKVVAVVLPGDRDVNEAKLRKLLKTSDVKFATEADFAAAGGVPGYVGPVGLKVRTIVDTSVDMRPYIAGANKKDTHLRNVIRDRDFKGEAADVHDVREGDLCPKCGGTLTIKRGVEVGNIFKFGPYYAEKMGGTYLAEDGTRKPLMFGSYGIGISRAVQTIIETHHDDKGILWPISVAPYQMHVIALPSNDEAVRAAAEALVTDLERAGVEVLYDDRDETAGVKFADADLIGIPYRVTVSKRTLKEDAVEVKLRSSSETQLVPRAKAVEAGAETVRRALAATA
ncbi:MAG TPA: proline--tRNA ligase [Candidatus Limnocylindria bacterium]|jgi:prolyl-tRNA synthetase|nr:proline--tRNA ligase [Candidatus Limnocylindria bacterium]